MRKSPMSPLTRSHVALDTDSSKYSQDHRQDAPTSESSQTKGDKSHAQKSIMEEIGEFKENFVESVAVLCGRWGGFVFDHPFAVSVFAILVAAFAVVGLIPGIAKWLDGAENLYTLPHTQAKNDGLVHNTLFNDALTLANFVLITSDPPGENIFTWEHLTTAQQVDNIVRGKMIDPVRGRRIALPALPEYLPGVTAATLNQRRTFDRRTHRSDTFNHTRQEDTPLPESLWSAPLRNNRRPTSPSYLMGSYTPSPSSARVMPAVPKAAARPERVITYEDMCAINPYGKCAVSSVFEMNVMELRKLLPPGAPPELYVLNGTIFNLDRKGFVPDYLLGGVEIVKCVRELPTHLLLNFYSHSQLMPGSGPGRHKAEMGCVKSVKAFHLVYELDDRKEFLPRNLAWMELMYDVMSYNKHYGNGLIVGANAFKSRDDELRRSTSESQDIIFVIFTFILIISYTALINFSCDLYKNRAVTALFGSLSTLLGILCGFGYTSLMGVSFVPTALVTPFLVMGVGCDDVFVIINSYALAYCEPTPRDRCIVTFKDCGVSVILTTATNLIAFGVGCQSPYAAIRNFCLFSLNGLAFSLFFELTIFYAVLCLDAQREVERRSCFFKSFDTKRSHGIEEGRTVATAVVDLFGGKRLSTFELVNYQVSHDWCARPGFVPTLKNRKERRSIRERFVDRGNTLYHSDVPLYNPNLQLASNHPAFTKEPVGNVGRQWRRFFGNVFCVILLQPLTKILTIIVFTLIAITAMHGVLSVEQGLELKDLSPDHSYLKVYDALYERFFGGYDIPVYIFFPDATPWWDPRVLRTVRQLSSRLANRPSTRFLNNPLVRIVDDPELGLGMNSGDQSLFESTLYEALSSPNSKYKQFEKDFAWEGPHLVSWKITLLPAGMSTSKERAQWMRNMREDCRSILALSDPTSNPERYYAYYPLKAVAWNYMMLFYESDLQIMSSVISSLTTAAISMFVVALILIPEVTSGLMVIFVMSLIDLAVMGFMYYWKVKLNMISMITLVISIGFSIDYSAHICHTFTHCLGRTRNLRAVECVVLMGTPVFHGAASTIVGIMVLGYSQSFIFRLFFKMMMLVLSFGIFHGLVLLPVLLSLFGKMPGAPLTDVQTAPLVTEKQLTVTTGSDDHDKPHSLPHKFNVSKSSTSPKHHLHTRQRSAPMCPSDGVRREEGMHSLAVSEQTHHPSSTAHSLAERLYASDLKRHTKHDYKTVIAKERSVIGEKPREGRSVSRRPTLHQPKPQPPDTFHRSVSNNQQSDFPVKTATFGSRQANVPSPWTPPTTLFDATPVKSKWPEIEAGVTLSAGRTQARPSLASLRKPVPVDPEQDLGTTLRRLGWQMEPSSSRADVESIKSDLMSLEAPSTRGPSVPVSLSTSERQPLEVNERPPWLRKESSQVLSDLTTRLPTKAADRTMQELRQNIRVENVPNHMRQKSLTSIDTLGDDLHFALNENSTVDRLLRDPENYSRQSSFLTAVPSFSSHQVSARSAMDSRPDTRLGATIDLPTHILRCLERSRLLERRAGGYDTEQRYTRMAARRDLRRAYSSQMSARVLPSSMSLISSASVTPCNRSQASAPPFLMCTTIPASPVEEPGEAACDRPQRANNCFCMTNFADPRTPRLVPYQK
eukprot:Blabericola_migrator_1__9453@NODE_511_length_7942_cov_30_679492_g392_i0_p1_GENE_NODE_511_length_7942_cov_30_679492_g392_i0NODE_511_length_7942_cov_30_679492_g392_i0_p1_ORF_typecomplete_len1629_score239_01Patched/PF02460_18/2_4e116Sterolsensing/PF12349_8/4_4e26Sterolsensing/PF12349_8/1_8e04Sterolsensing/PF12349_8/8_7e02MMPL/PF03176_15/2e02MMPL/PF03176_15/1e07MMPL/PF03176_15/2_3e11ACR_tran/PF00873_19/1_5e03ACR_tran/PF00873_19/1_4e03ACR_tran/PF00873_19/3_2e06FtsX/PF02687_21/1_1e03FtsX/PF02687_21/1_